jgi:hypothetical protein
LVVRSAAAALRALMAAPTLANSRAAVLGISGCLVTNDMEFSLGNCPTLGRKPIQIALSRVE